MSQVPPGGFDPSILTSSGSLRAAIEPIKLTPLPYTPPLYNSNNTYGRCSINEKPPEQRYWTNGPSKAELEARRKQMNTIGIWMLGPIAGGPPALVRLLGGSEDAVENAAQIGMNIVDIMGPDGKPEPGAFVNTRVQR